MTALQNLQYMGWTRRIFLLVGLVFLIGAVQSSDLFLGIAGVYLLAKSWFNWGCYGAGSCAVDPAKVKHND